MRKCKNPDCRKPFKPTFNTMQPTCSIPCAIELANIQKEKDRKKQNAADKKKLRESDRSWWLDQAQYYFNRWIRLVRDSAQPCISCGECRDTIQYAAGHYRTVGACPELRFEPRNCHKQCNRNCNQHKSGNVTEYRIRLIKRIGQEDVDWLEGPHDPKHYTIEDLREIRDHYKALCKEAGV